MLEGIPRAQLHFLLQEHGLEQNNLKHGGECSAPSWGGLLFTAARGSLHCTGML